MDEEKKEALSTEPEQMQEPEKPSYTPASKKKRIAAWIGVVFMVLLVLMYTYSIATGAILWW